MKTEMEEARTCQEPPGLLTTIEACGGGGGGWGRSSLELPTGRGRTDTWISGFRPRALVPLWLPWATGTTQAGGALPLQPQRPEQGQQPPRDGTRPLFRDGEGARPGTQQGTRPARARGS